MRMASGKQEKTGEKGLTILLESIVNSFPGAAGADYSEITLYDRRDNEFIAAAATLPERNEAFAGKKFAYAMDDRKKALTQNVMESKNPLIIHDVGEALLSDVDTDMIERLGIKSIAVFPMFAGDRFVGSIIFDYDGHTHKFTQHEINGMYGFADLAAHMIDYAQRRLSK